LQTYFPHDKRFNYENFAYTPINIIFQALEYGHRFYKEQLHCQELGIATLTSYFVNANKDPKKGSKVSPSDFFFFKPDQSNEICPDVATTFFSLVEDKLVPNWTLQYIPLKEFIALRGRGNIESPRALINQELQIIVIAPKIYRQSIYCQFIVAWEAPTIDKELITLKNIDSPEQLFRIRLLDEDRQSSLNLSYSNYTIERI
jgi:hypothetical protein